ncbi:hypothetical protein B0H14DRAFT_2621696 [Mycena olivaceomarginata]|nr:hypothetical protein B0H14DRAFT_2621696 [Mycena olivaceomarginata]
MLRWFTQSRKFCEEIAEVDLTAEQVGKVHMPFYMLTTLITKILYSRRYLGQQSNRWQKILMEFDLSYPEVANFAEHFKSVKAAEQRVPDWMRTIGLTPTPELEAVILPPLTSLPGHSLLSHIPLSERQELFFYSCWLSENELREPLNLNGDILDDLNTGHAVSCLTDSPKALSVMFGAILFNEGTTAKLKFNSAHIIYDPEFCPPTFRREDPSIFTPNYSYSGDAESK